MVTSLDSRIVDALAKINNLSGSEDFDINAYGAAFHQSAQEKARTVLELLGKQDCPFHGWKPVFVSVGGANGAELDFLLSNSSADVGILLEYNRLLAQAARERTARLPSNKRIVVIEGAAQEKIGEAMGEAYNIVRQGAAQFVAVTCHAVIHELFDRGTERFDAIGFFGQIFSDADIPLWFSYREPGRPEKWRDEVLLSANCSSQNLLALTNAVCRHHESLARLTPKPSVVGDRVRMNSTLAMEVLAKLFYIDDLAHEIEERSTAVEHEKLKNALHLAIGSEARMNGRGWIESASSPSNSFKSHWAEKRIRVFEINERDLSANELSVPESHTRVTAWREPTAPSERRDEETPPDLLLVCRSAFVQGDSALLEACLANAGRAWIEGPARNEARGMFAEIRAGASPDSIAHVLATYLNALPDLFNNTLDMFPFNETLEAHAAKHGLGLLIRAERMEHARKSGDLAQAVALANSLIVEITTAAPDLLLGRYQLGTVLFLLGNLLRQGGRYREALTNIERAERIYLKGVPSHDTELVHCQYARLACKAMRGDASLEGSSASSVGQQYRFASALMQLSFAHAAWLLNAPEKALEFAGEAAEGFRAIHFERYADRAELTQKLLRSWQQLETGKTVELGVFPAQLAKTLAGLIGLSGDLNSVKKELQEQRPGRALGLLQFARGNPAVLDRELDIEISPLIEITDERWGLNMELRVRSLRDADQVLRKKMGIEPGQKVPLLP
jgi:tetratricopeptide (TPR) repeat protein